MGNKGSEDVSPVKQHLLLHKVVDAEGATKVDVVLRLLEGEAIRKPREEAIHDRPFFKRCFQEDLIVELNLGREWMVSP